MSDYPADYLACGQCEAKRGGACFDLLAVGPEALPPRLRDRPHSARNVAGSASATTTRTAREPSATPPQRRAARRSATAAKGWAAVAARQGKL